MVSLLKRLLIFLAVSALHVSAQALPVVNGGTGTSSPALVSVPSYIACWGGSNPLGYCHIDDGVTTVSTITSTEKIAAPGFAGTGSDPFYNLPSNTTHSFSSGDLVNNAGVLQFNDGTTTHNLAYSTGSGSVTQLAQTVISGTTTTTINYGSISGSYTQLHLVINVQSSDVSADTLKLQFNSDTGSNYDFSSIFMPTSTSVSAGSSAAQTAITLSGGTPTVTSRAVSLDCVLPSYAGTAFFKNIQCSSAGWAGTTFLQLVAVGGAWRSTSAISSLTLFFGSGDHFVAGSTVTLYGVQ